MKLVMVEWIDSSSTNGWHNPSPEFNTFSICISVGILLYDNEERVSIAQSKSNVGNWAEIISIPKIAITRIRYLKVK